MHPHGCAHEVRPQPRWRQLQGEAAVELTLSDGTWVDLRSIRSPILVFCSRGDNITPPAQALSWISDLYTDNRDLQSYDQTIIYAVHEEIGHLGIFVSGGVARKEHREFSSNIDLIDVLPSGLYQATLRDKKALPGAELINGDYVLSFEPRAVTDLAVFGGTSPQDEKRFDAPRRVSEINLGLYRATLGTVLKQMANPAVAEALRQLHPARLAYTAYPAITRRCWRLPCWRSGCGKTAGLCRTTMRAALRSARFPTPSRAC